MTPLDQLRVGSDMVAHVTRGAAARDRVLWIHGYTMDSRIWNDLWNGLPAWSHIGVDLPGHGKSAPAPPGLDLVRLARIIGRFAIDQRVRHLVGLSFGGLVALQVGIEYPEAFASMVLGAPSLGGGPQDRRVQATNLELRRLYSARGRGPWLTDLWMTPSANIFAGAAKHPVLWRRLRQIAAEHAWHELADGRMHLLTAHRQLPSDLARIAAATLVLVGDEDADAFRRSAELIRRAIPNCRRVYLEQTGHLTLLERARTINPVLIAHFNTRAHDVACAAAGDNGA